MPEIDVKAVQESQKQVVEIAEILLQIEIACEEYGLDWQNL